MKRQYHRLTSIPNLGTKRRILFYILQVSDNGINPGKPSSKVQILEDLGSLFLVNLHLADLLFACHY